MVVHIHQDNPQDRFVNQVVDCLQKGGVIIYPTDSVYALGTLARNKEAIEKILKLKDTPSKKQFFTIMCPDISSVAKMTMPISNEIFKLMKEMTPGPVTFIHKANSRLTKMVHSRRQTVGVRIPDVKLIYAMLTSLEEDDVLVSTSLPPQGDDIDPNYITQEDLIAQYEKRVDMIVLSENPPFAESTVLDVSSGELEVVREGSVKIETY